MMRAAFERELQALQDATLSLGSVVAENLELAVEALVRRDALRSQRLIEADGWVNEQRILIGMEGLTLIATQQPIARDMRLIAAVLEIVGELERIHDYIKGIGRISLMIGEEQVPPPLPELMQAMAEKTRAMMRLALQAFARRDADAARAVPAIDDEVDAIYNQAYRAIIDYILQNPTAIESANRLEWAIHNLERSADRVTNICEWIVYMVDGRYQEMDSEVEAPPILEA